MIDPQYLSQLEQQNGLPPGLLMRQMMTESNGDPNAVSPKGAIGAFQFMPQTAQQYGIDPRDPNQSAQAAAQMMGQLNQKYNGNMPMALAGYNWGQGNVDRQGIQNAPPETQNYIQKVMGGIGSAIAPSAQAAESSTFDVTMPDGTIIKNVPQGTTQSELQARYAKIPPTQSTGILEDIGKGAATGIGQGAIALATGPVDLGAAAGGYLAKKAIGTSTLGIDPNGPVYDALNSVFGPNGLLPEKPPSLTTNAIDATGLNYKPQTVPGQYAQTMGNFIPAVAAATMGNGQPLEQNLMNIMKQSAFIGGGSETGGQLTKGTSLEPYARIAGGFAGAAVPAIADYVSGGTSNLMNGITARTPEDMQADASALKSAAVSNIEGGKQGGVIFNSDKSQQIINSIDDAINSKGFIPEMNPKTLAIANKIKSLAETGDLGLSDLTQYRTMLSRVAPTEDGVSAGAVRRAIGDAITSATPEDLASGTTDAIKQLQLGQKGYAAASRFEDVSDLLSKANGDPNRIKAALTRFAADPDNYRGWNKEQIFALKQAANTGIGENLLKAIGKFGFDFSKSGTGNTVLPALMSASQAAGNPVGVPMTVLGTAARQAQKYIARGKADKLLDLMSQMNQ